MTKKEKSSKQIDETRQENEVSITHFQDTIKANETLKEILKLALKQTSTTTREVLPKLSNAVVSYIKEFKQNLKDKTKTDEMMKLLSRTEIAKHCYYLVGYNRKDEVNDLFEKVVSRAIRLGIMIIDFPTQFAVDENTNDVFVMSNVLEPKIDVKIKGSKLTKKINNKDESLIPVSTYVVDKMYKAKYPTGSRTPTQKDEKAINNLKNISKEWILGFKKLINYTSNKNVKFFDVVDEQLFESFEEMKALLSGNDGEPSIPSNDYQNIRTFSVEYQADFNGKLEKVINQ
tara:strand:- start:491 stop:1354 length:864 start_codon:yes stop_codon:yes gene_type:complete